MKPTMGSAGLRMAVKYVGLGALMICTAIALLYAFPHSARHSSLHIPLRILPLGDDITWGWLPDHQEDGTNGYRAQLHHDLVYGWYTSIDFVGTKRSGLMYDSDNEGHLGYTIRQIHGAMKAGLAMRPNVVLLHAGTNDLHRPETETESWADAPGRLASLVDEVLTVCPDAVVILAKLIQAKDERTEANLRSFNDAIPALVEERRRRGHKVMLVDQNVVGATELVDGLHPTYSGYSHMGDVWFQGIRDATRKGLITTPVSLQQ